MSQGWCGAGLCRRGIAAAEQRQQNAEDGVLATRVAYMPLRHAQKEEGCREVLTEAQNRAGRPCRGGGVDGERRRTDGVRGRGCCRASPVVLVRWVDAGPCCKGAQGGRMAGGSPMALNRGGDRAHRWRRFWRNSGAARLGSGQASSVRLLVLRQRSSGGSWWLWCGRAAWPRWRRGVARRSRAGQCTRVWWPEMGR